MGYKDISLSIANPIGKEMERTCGSDHDSTGFLEGCLRAWEVATISNSSRGGGRAVVARYETHELQLDCGLYYLL